MKDVTVDLRPKMMPVRDQGDRPTCLAFAASDVHSLRQGLNGWLSPEYLYHRAGAKIPGWKISNGINLPAARLALEYDGQPSEDDCRYQNVKCDQVLTPELEKDAILYYSESTQGKRTPDELYRASVSSHYFVLALKITRSFFQPIRAPFVIDDDQAEVAGSHAVVLAGVAETEGEKFFLIRNSWGSDWADGGYAWLTANYIDKHMVGTLEFQRVA